jgi:hypothetical protein
MKSRCLGINQNARTSLAIPAFLTIRSPDRGRKAILWFKHRDRSAFFGIRAIEIRGFEEVLRARDRRV